MDIAYFFSRIHRPHLDLAMGSGVWTGRLGFFVLYVALGSSGPPAIGDVADGVCVPRERNSRGPHMICGGIWLPAVFPHNSIRIRIELHPSIHSIGVWRGFRSLTIMWRGPAGMFRALKLMTIIKTTIRRAVGSHA